MDRPETLDEMLNIARKLSEPFDMVRVDLYSVEDQVFFGELTHYPRGGYGSWDPQSFDFELGKRWNQQPDYWEK